MFLTWVGTPLSAMAYTDEHTLHDESSRPLQKNQQSPLLYCHHHQAELPLMSHKNESQISSRDTSAQIREIGEETHKAHP
jgi:hypothetical protein